MTTSSSPPSTPPKDTRRRTRSELQDWLWSVLNGWMERGMLVLNAQHQPLTDEQGNWVYRPIVKEDIGAIDKLIHRLSKLGVAHAGINDQAEGARTSLRLTTAPHDPASARPTLPSDLPPLDATGSDPAVSA